MAEKSSRLSGKEPKCERLLEKKGKNRQKKKPTKNHSPQNDVGQDSRQWGCTGMANHSDSAFVAHV